MKRYTDLSYLKELTDDDNELIIQSLKRYFNTSSVQLENLLQGTQDHKWDEIHNSAHSLFATTQIIGITELAQTLKDLQLLAREERDFDAVKDMVHQVRNVINVSYVEVREHLERLENS